MLDQFTFLKKWIIHEKQENSLLKVYNPLGVKLLTRVRLQSSHIKEHKFRRGFSDTVNSMCACGTEIETAEHFFLRCHLYSTQRLKLFESLKKADSIFLNLNEKGQVNTLLYGSQTNDSKCVNQEILKLVITYIKATTRFDRSLISNQWKYWFISKILIFVNMFCRLDMYLYLADFNLMIIPICSTF